MSIFSEWREFRKWKREKKSFKRFTDDARQTVVFAQQLEADSIGPQELMIAARQIQFGRIPDKDGPVLGRGMKPFTVAGKQALARSLRLAVEANDAEITPQHIFDAAAQVIEEHNAKYEAAG